MLALIRVSMREQQKQKNIVVRSYWNAVTDDCLFIMKLFANQKGVQRKDVAVNMVACVNCETQAQYLYLEH